MKAQMKDQMDMKAHMDHMAHMPVARPPLARAHLVGPLPLEVAGPNSREAKAYGPCPYFEGVW